MAKKAKKKTTEAENRLGVLLSELRQKRKLSMQKLAQASGISAAYICRIESGERHPSRELLQTLADVLIPETNQADKDELLIAAGFAPTNFRNFMGRQDVLTIYQKALAQNPLDFRSYIALVLSLIRSGQHEQARTHINEGMQRFDDMVQLQALMAALELSKSNHEQAIRFQEEALRYYQLEEKKERLNLTYTDLLLGLGVMHFDRGHILSYARMRAQEDGDQAAALAHGEKALLSLHQACRVFQQSLEIDPDDVYVLDELARVHFTVAYNQVGDQLKHSQDNRLEHWRSCIDAFERAVCSKNKQDLGYHALLQSTAFLALAYSKAGDFKQAWFTISVVEACLPNYWLIHYVKACHFGLKILNQHDGQRTGASEGLFKESLNALEKSVLISDPHNQAREEAALDPDLEPLRIQANTEFRLIMSKREQAV